MNTSKDNATNALEIAKANELILEDLRNANSALIEAKAYLRNTLNRGLNVKHVKDASFMLKDLVEVSEHLEACIHHRLDVELVIAEINRRESAEGAII